MTITIETRSQESLLYDDRGSAVESGGVFDPWLLTLDLWQCARTVFVRIKLERLLFFFCNFGGK